MQISRTRFRCVSNVRKTFFTVALLYIQRTTVRFVLQRQYIVVVALRRGSLSRCVCTTYGTTVLFVSQYSDSTTTYVLIVATLQQLYVGGLSAAAGERHRIDCVSLFFLAVPVRDLFFYVPPILSVRHRRHVFSISVRSYSRTGGNALICRLVRQALRRRLCSR